MLSNFASWLLARPLDWRSQSRCRRPPLPTYRERRSMVTDDRCAAPTGVELRSGALAICCSVRQLLRRFGSTSSGRRGSSAPRGARVRRAREEPVSGRPSCDDRIGKVGQVAVGSRPEILQKNPPAASQPAWLDRDVGVRRRQGHVAVAQSPAGFSSEYMNIPRN